MWAWVKQKTNRPRVCSAAQGKLCSAEQSNKLTEFNFNLSPNQETCQVLDIAHFLVTKPFVRWCVSVNLYVQLTMRTSVRPYITFSFLAYLGYWKCRKMRKVPFDLMDWEKPSGLFYENSYFGFQAHWLNVASLACLEILGHLNRLFNRLKNKFHSESFLN